MRLATPNFKNKMAATIWMLFLALSLILVDYFLAEVQAIAGWDYEKLDLEKKNSIIQLVGIIKSSSSCTSQERSYQVNPQQQLVTWKEKPSQKMIHNADVGTIICAPSGEVFFTQLSDHQGGLWCYSLGEKKKILTHLHQAEDFFLTASGDLYLVERGRERLIKVFRKN